MDNQIICPHCKKEIAITEALSHQMQSQIKAEREQAEKRIEEEKKKMRVIAEQWRESESKRLEDKYAQTQREIESKLKEKVQKEMELKFLDTKNENEEIKKEKQEYNNASIIVYENAAINDSTHIINYQNSYDKVGRKVKVVLKNDIWQVDFKYTFNPNL